MNIIIPRRKPSSRLLAEFFPGWTAMLYGEPVGSQCFSRVVVLQQPIGGEEESWLYGDVTTRLDAPGKALEFLV